MENSLPQHPIFKLPETMPVIVLEECYLFPGCYLPLFIFEQRYRQMLNHALNNSRMFCIGTRMTPGEHGEILPVSTAGLIRACKSQTDGTSNVMLFGVNRIRITGWTQERPFRIATVEPIPTICQVSKDALKEMKDAVLKMLPLTSNCPEGLKLLRGTVEQTACADTACDILTYHFVHCPATLHRLLEEPVLEKRYAMLMKVLEKHSAAE